MSASEIFICEKRDFTSFRDDQASMLDPIFSLSKKGDDKVRTYVRKTNKGEEDVRVTITPSVLGAATVYDKDLLIYVISQVTHAKNLGLPISKTIKINTYDFLDSTGRGDGRRSFEAILGMLRRLSGTRILTNIKTGGIEQIKEFGLLNGFTVLSCRSGSQNDGERVLSFEVELSEWIMNGLEEFQVLSLNEGYFGLQGSIERRLYEIARFRCRGQAVVSEHVDTLMQKVGTSRPRYKFRDDLRKIMQKQPLPDYGVALEVDGGKEQVVFYTKNNLQLMRYLQETNRYSWFERLERGQGNS